MGRIVGWVDDEPTVRRMASRLVERGGGELHEFLDHAALLDSAQNIAFDAVVLQPRDSVPVMEVLAFFRGAPRPAQVILASGSATSTLEDQDIDVSAFDAFLRKPFTGQEVLDAVWPDRRPAAPHGQPSIATTVMPSAGSVPVVARPRPGAVRLPFDYAHLWDVCLDLNNLRSGVMGFRELVEEANAEGVDRSMIDEDKKQLSEFRARLRRLLADGVACGYWSRSEAAALARVPSPEAHAAARVVRSRLDLLSGLIPRAYGGDTSGFSDPSSFRVVRERSVAQGLLSLDAAARFDGQDYATIVAATNGLLAACLAVIRRRPPIEIFPTP